MIKWLDWEKAKKQKKPVLLSISATWCHWCHTMDRETYSNPKISAFINKNFITVRVDTDERPDINSRYNVGGWPTTAILASDGEPVSAATYVSPQHMIGFLEDSLQRFKKYKPTKIKKRVEKPVEFDQEEFSGMINSFYDPANGGFGLEPKFPHHDILEYLFWRALAFNDSNSKKMLDTTLSKMLDGEIFDHTGGGFYRYATHRNWTIPHFEKMLEDNARLLSSYLIGYRLFKRKKYLVAANKTLLWLFTFMYDYKTGLFYSSQDADENYCKLPINKRVLQEVPFVDKTIYTDCNAVIALALFEAANFEPTYEEIAFKLLDSLYKLNVSKQVLHSKKSVPLLKDTVYLLAALTQVYRVTKKDYWKKKMLTVAKALEKFYDKKNGGFFDIIPSKTAFGRLKQPNKPVHENAFAALVLNSVPNKKYEQMAKKTLEAVSAQAVMIGPFAATYAIAVAELRKS